MHMMKRNPMLLRGQQGPVVVQHLLFAYSVNMSSFLPQARFLRLAALHMFWADSMPRQPGCLRFY